MPGGQGVAGSNPVSPTQRTCRSDAVLLSTVLNKTVRCYAFAHLFCTPISRRVPYDGTAPPVRATDACAAQGYVVSARSVVTGEGISGPAPCCVFGPEQGAGSRPLGDVDAGPVMFASICAASRGCGPDTARGVAS